MAALVSAILIGAGLVLADPQEAGVSAGFRTGESVADQAGERAQRRAIKLNTTVKRMLNKIIRPSGI